ncbi:MAG: 30S ribosomal protein S9 [Candidatus Omnitrophica bacterium]|nr:30S ribosomal protein S9 [Candidatus Omnitrophota bacterium]
MDSNLLIAVGRRKSSHTIAKMKQGTGNVVINGKKLSEYFPLFYLQDEVLKPLKVTNLDNQFDIELKAQGGGIHGQVDASKLAIARAIAKFNPQLIPDLRKFDLLTRNPKMKERKKYGRKGARKRFQWTKR